MMRKAYLYSIEGVLASMLVVFYLSTLVIAPAGEDWTRTSLSKRSGDLLTALSRTGILDRIVRQDSSRILRGLLVAMEAQLDYSIHIRGLPKRRVELMVAMTDEDIHRTGNTPNSTPIGTGLPRSESGYRTGTIHGVPYAVSDTATNGVTQFTSVNFDFNGNNQWGEIDGRLDEGPYRFGDLVRWCRGYPPCQEQWFRVGYINDSLTLYNVTKYRRFRQTASFEANSFHINVVTSSGQLFPALNVSGSDFQHQGDFWTADIPFNGLTLDVNVSSATGNTTVYLNESSGFHGPYEEGEQVQIYGGFYTIRQVDPENGRFYAVPENAISADILFLDGVQPS
ncbi:MAG: hypothetical protein SVU32_03620, partial [Candidatus Nanohaloarchaea archaeon]|nr:hypothetical protein [Candidatus Nanohaloarchaea archaeon]